MSSSCNNCTQANSYGDCGGSKVFRVLNCFQQIAAGACGWTTGYCIQLMIILTLSLLNFSLLLYLLINDVKNRKLKTLA